MPTPSEKKPATPRKKKVAATAPTGIYLVRNTTDEEWIYELPRSARTPGLGSRLVLPARSTGKETARVSAAELAELRAIPAFCTSEAAGRINVLQAAA